MSEAERLPLALTAFGLPHVMGYLATRSGERAEPVLDAFGLMDAALELGLSGIEAHLPALSGAPLAAWREALAVRGLRLVAALPVPLDAQPEQLRGWFETAAALGASVVRSTLSSILCGDRRGLAGGWPAHLEQRAARLREVLPYARDLGLCLAIENHQDATSDDLLRLAEMLDHSPAYGVTLDTGNPLAVGEDPVEFTRRVAPLVRHVHLKDYTLHNAPEGFRLVRCAAGEGVVDFAAISSIVSQNGHALLPGIEIAAQATRTIPLLAPDWWACYPPNHATQLLPVLQLIWEKARPRSEPYSSAWERGADSAQVQAEEWDLVRRSAAYFRRLLASAPPGPQSLP
jgi:3-oxoisoapionate decarboxylase